MGSIREASCYLDERVPQVCIILEKHRGWFSPSCFLWSLEGRWKEGGHFHTHRETFSLLVVGDFHRTSRELLVRVTVAIGSFQTVRLW